MVVHQNTTSYEYFLLIGQSWSMSILLQSFMIIRPDLVSSMHGAVGNVDRRVLSLQIID